MSRRLSFLLLSSFLFVMIAPIVAEAQFYPIFHKTSADDDDVDPGFMGFPPAHPCPDPCNEVHFILRITNCGNIEPDGTCNPVNPPITGGEVVDEVPLSLPLDCARGVNVMGDGTWDAPVCDPATNTVTVSNMNIDSGGVVEIDFWTTVACESGGLVNQATFQYDQNPHPDGLPLQARDPDAMFGGGGFGITIGEPANVSFEKDVPALSISGMPPMRTAPPGSTQRWVLTGGNPTCEVVTVFSMQDIEDPRGCIEVDCNSLRMFINDMPVPIPPDTVCPEPTIPLAFVLGEFVLQPGDTWRLEYNARFTGVGGPECCNLGDFGTDAGPNIQTSDPGLDAPLMPESTCVVLVDAPEPVLNAVKAATDEMGNEIFNVEPGQIIDWHFTIENNGGADGMGDLDDVFPDLAVAGPGALILPPPTGTCTMTGQVLDCDDVELPAGGSVEIIVRTTVDCAATGADFICNEGTLTAMGMSNPTHCPSCPAMPPGTETCVQVQAPSFGLSSKEVTDGDDEIADVGETLTWTITPLNDGTTDASNVIVTDTIPAGLSFVPGSLALDGAMLTDGADGDAGEVIGSDLTVRVGDVAPVSGLGIITFQTTVDSLPGPEICNDAAMVTWDGVGACPDGNVVLADACIPTSAAPLVTASKSVSPTGDVNRGEILTYSVEACADAAGLPASGVSVVDLIPAGSTYQNGSMTLDGGSLTDAADGDGGEYAAGPPAQVTIDIGDLMPGECRTVTFDVAVDGDASGTITNIAAVSGAGVPSFDTNTVANDVTVPNPTELSATKSVSPTGEVAPDSTLTFTIDTCNGPAASDARNVALADLIPVGTTYVAMSMTLDGAPLTDVMDLDAGMFVAGPPASIAVALGDLTAGECKTVTFDVTVDTATVADVVNVANITSDSADPFDTNMTTTPIDDGGMVDPPILSISKSSMLVDPPPAMVGGTIAYTLTACNDMAGGPADGVVVTDPIPLDAVTGCGGAFVAGSIQLDSVMQTDAADGDAGRFEMAPGNGQVVVDLGTLDPGECNVIEFQVTIEAGCDDMESVDNTATLTATGEPSMDSNSVSDVVGVDPPMGPTMMRKEGFPIMNQCPDPDTMCGCAVGSRLDPIADDCVAGGTCSETVPDTEWLVPGDQLTGGATLVFYEVDGDGCLAAGDTTYLVVEKTGTDDITVKLIP